MLCGVTEATEGVNGARYLHKMTLMQSGKTGFVPGTETWGYNERMVMTLEKECIGA